MSDELNVRIWLSVRKRLESSAEGCQRRRWRNRRWQAVPHVRSSNRKCSAVVSGTVNWRLDGAVAAGRAKSSATCKVGNVLSERAKVRRCTAVDDIVYVDAPTQRMQDRSSKKLVKATQAHSAWSSLWMSQPLLEKKRRVLRSSGPCRPVKVLAVNLRQPSGQHQLYANLIGLTLASSKLIIGMGSVACDIYSYVCQVRGRVRVRVSETRARSWGDVDFELVSR